MTDTSPATAPACPICQSTDNDEWARTRDIEYFSLEGEFAFRHCNPCGVLFIDPMPTDKLAEIYPTNYYSFVHGLDSPIYAIKTWLDSRLFKKLLKRIPGDSLNVIDVGGGTGWQLDVVRKLDPRVALTQVVDIDDASGEEAVANGHRYFHGRYEEFESTDKFDLVIMLNLIEHVANPLAMLEKTNELLSPGGLALIKTPNFDSIDARIFRHRNWSGYHCPRHWVLFTKESFRKCADRAGLEYREFHYTQGAPFWSGSVINWLTARGLTRMSSERPMLTHPLSTPLFAVGAAFDFLRLPFSKTSQMFIVLGKK